MDNSGPQIQQQRQCSSVVGLLKRAMNMQINFRNMHFLIKHHSRRKTNWTSVNEIKKQSNQLTVTILSPTFNFPSLSATPPSVMWDMYVYCKAHRLQCKRENGLFVNQGSANFFGSRAGWAPKELAAGQTAKFHVKNLITGLTHPLIMMSCHVCKSTERKRGDFWYFVQDCFKINSASFQLYTIFQLHQKCPNCTRLVTEGLSVKGVSQRQCINECKRADQRWLSVCD